MGGQTLHQFAETALIGDATSDQAFIIQRWLRELGFHSEIFVERIDRGLQRGVRPANEYRPQAGEKFVLHHHAIGSSIAERIATIQLPQILIYHNITPPEFFSETNPTLAASLKKGREQLVDMVPRTSLALGDSDYNEVELKEVGFKATGVLPIVLNESLFAGPINEALALQCGAMKPIILFVGRMAPNKRQEDLIKLLYFLRRVNSQAHLILVGNADDQKYVDWQMKLSREMGLGDSMISFVGHVSHQDMLTYYRCADVYVSMSEHEGFGKPLIESMYCGLPVVAYASSAVPFTLGDAGVLFYEKDFEALAELVDILIKDQALRRRIVTRQTRRVESFLEQNVRHQFESYLRQLGLLPIGSRT